MHDAAVSALGLTKRFGELQALAGIDLEVPAGSVCGLLGPNGAGKTTIVRILATILQPDAGQVRVMGADVVHEAQAVRERIGLAGQFVAVDDTLTGRENLELFGRLGHLPRRAIASRVVELLAAFDLTDAADRPAGTWSGGMRRRLDLAVALVHRPAVVFLDEPTAGLDVVSRNDLWNVVEALASDGTTVLLTTQYLEEADRLADQLVVVDEGRVIAEGPPAQLKSGFTTMIDIRLPAPEQAGRAAQLLAGAGHPAPVLDGARVELAVPDGTDALVGILLALDRAGMTPIGIEVRPPTLDDVFLSLAGRRADPPGRDRSEQFEDAVAR